MEVSLPSMLTNAFLSQKIIFSFEGWPIDYFEIFDMHSNWLHAHPGMHFLNTYKLNIKACMQTLLSNEYRINIHCV